jgi:shikimate kinase
MKVLVVGVAGTGKSYLVREMKRRGLNAFDADEGFATFVDADGTEVEYDPEGGAEWWKSHNYVLKPEALEKMFSSDKTAFLFGDVGGQPGKGNGLFDVAHRFDRVCYLSAPVELIRERLSNRTDNTFGKNLDEVEGTVKHKAKMDKIARERGFEKIDTTLPTEEIIEILIGSKGCS